MYFADRDTRILVFLGKIEIRYLWEKYDIVKLSFSPPETTKPKKWYNNKLLT